MFVFGKAISRLIPSATSQCSFLYNCSIKDFYDLLTF